MQTRLRTALIILSVLLVLPSLTPSSLPAGEIIVKMRKARPNPFTDYTVFQLTMPRDGQVYIAVYDLVGRHIRTLKEGYVNTGSYDVRWNGDDIQGTKVPPGPYLCTLFMDNRPVSCAKVVKAHGTGL